MVWRGQGCILVKEEARASSLRLGFEHDGFPFVSFSRSRGRLKCKGKNNKTLDAGQPVE